MQSLLQRSVLGLALLTITPASIAHAQPEAQPQPEVVDLAGLIEHGWADHPVWHDGLAEIATYDASRRIYGQPRAYTAQMFTNKERLDRQTFTKSADGQGDEVFKFHVRDEDIPTAKYDYNFSTMAYVTADGLDPVKLDMGSQEDCGASFKRFEQRDPKTLRFTQYSYFPDQGFREGTGSFERPVAWLDTLPLVLRGYPFHDPLDTLRLGVVPEQTTTKWSSVNPEVYELTYAGREPLDLPIGNINAHKLVLRFVGPTREARPDITLHFHPDPDTRHVLVAYDDPHLGQTYRLKALERDAYWR
jgi:hypothetical protein